MHACNRLRMRNMRMVRRTRIHVGPSRYARLKMDTARRTSTKITGK